MRAKPIVMTAIIFTISNYVFVIYKRKTFIKSIYGIKKALK